MLRGRQRLLSALRHSPKHLATTPVAPLHAQHRCGPLRWVDGSIEARFGGRRFACREQDRSFAGDASMRRERLEGRERAGVECRREAKRAHDVARVLAPRIEVQHLFERAHQPPARSIHSGRGPNERTSSAVGGRASLLLGVVVRGVWATGLHAGRGCERARCRQRGRGPGRQPHDGPREAHRRGGSSGEARGAHHAALAACGNHWQPFKRPCSDGNDARARGAHP